MSHGTSIRNATINRAYHYEQEDCKTVHLCARLRRRLSLALSGLPLLASPPPPSTSLFAVSAASLLRHAATKRRMRPRTPRGRKRPCDSSYCKIALTPTPTLTPNPTATPTQALVIQYNLLFNCSSFKMCWCRSWYHTCILPSRELYARSCHVTVSYTVNSPTRVRYSRKKYP